MTPHIYNFDQNTWIECVDGVTNSFRRNGRAICSWDDVSRKFRAKDPDTFYSIPARMEVDGKTLNVWITLEDCVLIAHKEKVDG